MLSHRIEAWLVGIWYTNMQVPILLRGLSQLYGFIIKLRTSRCRDLVTVKPPIPIVVVGNITAGGTGKTPVVAALAQSLLDSGYRVAVISKGFRRGVFFRSPSYPRLVSAMDDPRELGDEPVWLAQRLDCPVWVSENRAQSAMAAQQAGAQVVISDDGLQHTRLPRSFEICVVDGRRGFGNERLLPAGPLREPLERLDEVDAVLVKGPNQLECADFVFDLKAVSFLQVGSGQSLETQALAGQSVIALCAIGDPRSFETTLEQLGLMVELRSFPDHHLFTLKDLQPMHGERTIVVTEKDWVKLEHLSLSQALKDRLYVLSVRATLDQACIQWVEEHVKSYDRIE